MQIVGVQGLPEIEPGRRPAAALDRRGVAADEPLADGDVVVVTSKIVSKAEGRTVELDDVEPSRVRHRVGGDSGTRTRRSSSSCCASPSASSGMVGPVLITETHHGFVCANSGDRPVLERRPRPGRAAARRLRRVGAPASAPGSPRSGVDVAVIVSDTFGRAWREGQTDIAIGIAGHRSRCYSYIGQVDPHGHEFRVQELCVVDELAGAAELVKGNTSRVPVAVIRGYAWEPDDEASMGTVLRDAERDLFR